MSSIERHAAQLNTTTDGRCKQCERYRDEAWHGQCDVKVWPACSWCDNDAHTLLGTELDPACHAHALRWAHTYAVSA